jgi:hypothetical protein
VVLPPPELAHYGATWARPAAAGGTTGAAALQARLDAVRARHPRLDCYGRMHSHPGRTGSRARRAPIAPST